MVKELRIRNFKSYENTDIDLSNNIVLLGANNVGKTSLLDALQIAFFKKGKVKSEDIYVKEDEILPKDRKAIIDTLIVPTDENGNRTEDFDENWFRHFGELRSEDIETLDQFVPLRTIITYDEEKAEYSIQRKILIEWPKSEDVVIYEEYKRAIVNEKVLSAIPVFYMDAKRDIALEMKDKNSYWGKLIKDLDIGEEEVNELEESLSRINNKIIDNSEILKHLSENLSYISKTVKTSEESIKIDPVSRKIRDLNRGMDLTLKDENSERFPISDHGMGTRSWATFLTVVAYIKWRIMYMEKKERPFHPIILLEEPEAHLHPQAQRKIFKQIFELIGQKIISTHSPIIGGQTKIENIRHISKNNGTSAVNKIDIKSLDRKQTDKINQEILKSRGDLLFADAMILCEGETEEQALSVFFRNYFNCDAFEVGITIISVNGFGNYEPFINIASNLDINFYIFSDGEKDVKKRITRNLQSSFGENKKLEDFRNVICLPNYNNFEDYLMEENYNEELFKAMQEVKGDDFLEEHIEKKHGSKLQRYPTEKTCKTCKQSIYETEYRDYSGVEGRDRALKDAIENNKIAYSSKIATVILERQDERKYPPLIKQMFEKINEDLNIL